MNELWGRCWGECTMGHPPCKPFLCRFRGVCPYSFKEKTPHNVGCYSISEKVNVSEIVAIVRIYRKRPRGKICQF